MMLLGHVIFKIAQLKLFLMEVSHVSRQVDPFWNESGITGTHIAR